MLFYSRRTLLNTHSIDYLHDWVIPSLSCVVYMSENISIRTSKIDTLPFSGNIWSSGLGYGDETRWTSRYCTSSSQSTLPVAHSTIRVRFERGLPLLNVTLPSRGEVCQFSLRPLTDNVGSFCDQLQREDRGLDFVAVYTKGAHGVRVATSTSVEHLLLFGEFRLRLNDRYYDVVVSEGNIDEQLGSDRCSFTSTFSKTCGHAAEWLLISTRII
ncbi:unnamed protein product [Strongylus vulgaris]|uniref:Uncharacterized protein n=1 Tax=Strongylus vulgaris TaxID=40348 RepID=A0A3P7I9V6_STRVU|nr:unnamed protein product [Strongylus vulgaris]